MSGAATGMIGFVAVVLLIMARVPVAIAMGVVGAVGLGLLNGWSSLAFILGRAPFEAVFPVGLSVVPLFVMMGAFAAYGGLSRALYGASVAFFGHFRGGLAISTVGASAMFGAICGSSLATAATIGRIAMPEMRRLGYQDSLASASVAAGGTLGVMIPPSVLLIVYGLLTEQSIGKLFAAGVLPGILGMLLYMAAVSIRTARNPALGPAAPRVDWRGKLLATASIWKVLLLFAVVLGGMYLGWFSPTEAAAVGAAGALLLGLLSRQLDRRSILSGLQETVLTTAMIFLILIGAAIFNYFVESSGLPDALIASVEKLGLSPTLVLLVLVILFVALGCLMDSLSMMMLTIPGVFPLVTALGYDPIWFGVIMVTLAEIGMITPPVGMNLFVLQGVVPGLTMQSMIRGITPFVVADLVRVALLVAFPMIALWLPSGMN